ncbi:MAG: porphobilinogen synthase [Anaerolineales bacterium]|nr:porphobilinogen synthase [Anaerolineales bacterium]
MTSAKQKFSSDQDIQRTRRLRRLPGLRALVRETHLSPQDFILPIFVRHGSGEKREIVSMPGVYQWSVDRVNEIAGAAAELGIPGVILFGIPEHKDPVGEENFAPDGVVQRAIRAIKGDYPEIVVVTDVCLCEYTDHGHCGVLNTGDPLPNPNLPEGHVLNDPTLSVLGKVARSHAEAGADVVAPSGMMDGMVLAIRRSLDEAAFEHIPILSYAVKFASSFYGPFRDAAESPPKFGDRRSHQMDPANGREALREAKFDLDEGADMLMVKPALPYLDVIYRVKTAHPEIPLGAYNVSGEYAMIKAAAANGWIDARGTILELLTGIKRAGADMILTYHAIEAAAWIAEG